MIFTDQMKNLKVYRKPLFLPTMEESKKKDATVLLMTPNYESSKRLMQHPLLINRLRYQSYYAERDLTRFLSSKTLNRVEESTIEEEVIQEKYIKNEKDIYYNKEAFDNGDINLCFITGHSGSGKSTMGRNMSSDDNIEHYELDDVLSNKLYFTMEQLKEYGDLIYSFFNGVGKKYFYTPEDLDSPSSHDFYIGRDYDTSIIRSFIEYAMDYSKSHKKKKYVIEGIWFWACDLDPSKFVDYAVYIKGTSAMSSAFRALKRNINNDKMNGEPPNLFQKIRMGKEQLIRNLDGEKQVEKWRRFFSGRMSAQVQEGAGSERKSKFDWMIDGGPPYELVPVEKEYGVYVDKRYNACIKLKGYKPLRGRSEMIIVNEQRQVYVWFKEDGSYEFPGGSWDEGEDHMQCAIREAKEEARMLVKDVCDYLPYIDHYEPDKWQEEHIPKEMQWYGTFNELYLALYDGTYNGPVEKVDREDGMLKNGRFYDLKEIEDKIDPGYVVAICAYLYQGMRDKFIEDDAKANQFIRDCHRSNAYPYLHEVANGLNLSMFKLINNPSKEFIKAHIDDADCIKDFLEDTVRKNSCMFLDIKNNKIACVFMVFNDGGHKILNNFEVITQYRKQGLSKQLLDYAVKEKGADHLWVNNDNTIAKNLYIKYGFKFTGDKMKDGGHTRLYMSLENSINEASLLFGNIDLIEEDSKYDTRLKQLLYNDRIKQRKDIVEINKKTKEELPFIKYAYPELEKYNGKNLFMDFYYYNEVFFRNNDWEKQRGYGLYLDLLERLLTDRRLDKLGYKKKTVFVPIQDWNTQNDSMWLYRESINPISVIYELLRTKSLDKLNTLFKNMDIVFFGKDKYFKINFKDIKQEELNMVTVKFKMFIIKMIAGQEFDPDDFDESLEAKESPKAIKANIMDKIEASKGIDLTGKDVAVQKRKEKNKAEAKKNEVDIPDPLYGSVKSSEPTLPAEETEKHAKEKKLLKGTDLSDEKKKERTLERLAADIDRISQDATDTDDALDNHMDNLKSVLIDLDSIADDTPTVDPARAARMNKLDQQFLEKKLNGKTIREILERDTTKDEIKTTSLNISSPNEEWKNLTYMNFDKDYDLNRDIIACLKHFQTVSNPISIRNIDIKNTSTSEDRVNLYTVEMEDTRGKRFSIKFDVPIMIDNRFLLRGNDKSINTQFCNMPIIKTDLDAAQIVTNYQKIFVYRVNTVSGRSHPLAGRFLKAAQKYKGTKLKFSFGDNTKICNKYDLPIDYIDIASVINRIETPNHTIYFNQDEIRNDYPNIDDSLGIPYAVSKKDNTVAYYEIQQYGKMTFTADLLYNFILQDNEFNELFQKATAPSSGTYSRCNLMSSKIPMIVVLGYMEGMTKTLRKANISYQLVESLTKEIREQKMVLSWIRFKDGYLVYETDYISCMLLNGLLDCSTDLYSIYDIDNKNIYLEMLDNFGGRIKADGLDNFYDCLVDPITKEVLEHYNLPTDVVSIFLYANMLLSDNKFTRHTDISSRRIRRNELVAAYGYEALSESYGAYSNQMKHNKARAEFIMKQSVIIDKILTSPISSDDSTINAIRDLETTNAVSYKGKSGLNNERSYSLDKRTYDDSMVNVLGASTGFSGNTGITRQTTLDMGVEGYRGYIKMMDGDTTKMNSAKTLTATEAVTPFGSTRDDGMRTNMTFIQTAKHSLRTEESDPLLVTNGADEAIPYLTTDKFAFKAKKDGKIKLITDEYIIVEYADGTKDFVNLKERVMKNSDGGNYQPLKLDPMAGLRPGKKIKENEILAYDSLSFSNSVGETDNIAYNIGKLAKVAIINTDEGYEDSGMTVETMSDKLSSRIILGEKHSIDKEANVFSIAKIGDHVEVNDALLVWQDPYEEEDANILLKTLADSQEEVSELGRRAIRSETSGKITDITISRTVELDELSESLRKIVVEYERKINKTRKMLESEGIDPSFLPATYKLEPTGKLKNVDGVLFEFFIEFKDIIAVGDKITYYSANKAVTKTVVPREKAPYTDFRPNEPIDAFVSEVSIDKRMVGSTPIYGSLQKLMIELDRSCKDLAGIPYDDSKV